MMHGLAKVKKERERERRFSLDSLCW